MNYVAAYDNLIRTRKERVPVEGVYYETHHVIMKSMGGSDEPENLVKLTAREHFLAHLLLVKIHGCWKTKLAFGYMCVKNPNASSRLYAEAKEAMSFAAKERHSMGEGIGTYGMTYSQESRDKMSKSQLGLKRSVSWEHTPETIENMKKAQNSRSEEWKENLKKNHPRTKTFLNRTHSETTKELIRQKLRKKKNATVKQCPHCLKEGSCSGFARWHFANCKKKAIS